MSRKETNPNESPSGIVAVGEKRGDQVGVERVATGAPCALKAESGCPGAIVLCAHPERALLGGQKRLQRRQCARRNSANGLAGGERGRDIGDYSKPRRG